MKAIVRTKAGKEFSTMRVEQIQSAATQVDELKVRMISSRINPVDMDLMKGFPSLKYKTPQIGGVDGAGTVIEVGAGVHHFQIGDTVLFYRKFSDIGAWAEEITVKAADCARAPGHIAPKEIGAIALPILTAYESLMQLGAQKGEKILIHGAGGGVGFQAVLVAKKMGLYVIGTASQHDHSVLEKAGLDQFIDYKSQDFTTVLRKGSLDYVFDLLGNEVLTKSIKLQPKKVISVKYIVPDKLAKSGVYLSGILKWIMALMMRKYDMLAKKNQVELIGQVTGANGALLQQAIDWVSDSFISRAYHTRTLEDIAVKGLTKNDLGKVILFNTFG